MDIEKFGRSAPKIISEMQMLLTNFFDWTCLGKTKLPVYSKARPIPWDQFAPRDNQRSGTVALTLALCVAAAPAALGVETVRVEDVQSPSLQAGECTAPLPRTNTHLFMRSGISVWVSIAQAAAPTCAGLVAANERRYDAAERFFQLYLTEEPGSASGWSNLANVHLSMGKTELAVQQFSKSVELAPEVTRQKAPSSMCSEPMRPPAQPMRPPAQPLHVPPISHAGPCATFE